MFEIFKDKSESFRFRLKSKDGDIILASEGYTQKTNCQKGVGSVRRNSKNEDRFEIKESKDKKWYFNLKAGNGQVVAVSDLFKTESDAKSGIIKIMEVAPASSTTDLTKVKKSKK